MLYKLFFLILLCVPLSVFAISQQNTVDSHKWQESGISYEIEIVQIKSGQFFSPDWKVTLTARKCRLKEDQCDEIWHIRDFSKAVYQHVNYQKGSLKLADFNHDGKTDSVFFYTIDPDGTDSFELKAMFHINNKKYAIRGIIPKQFDNLSDFSYRFDDAFRLLDRKTLLTCKAIWDQYLNTIFLYGEKTND